MRVPPFAAFALTLDELVVPIVAMPPKRDFTSEDGTPAGDADPVPPAKKPKKEKVVVPDNIPQDPAPRQPPPPAGTTPFKCVCWNVAGLRALMEKKPETLRAVVDAESPDVIALNEHKLQESHVVDLTAKLRELLPEYPTARFAVSTAKKGYSGVAVLARAALPTDARAPASLDAAAKRGTISGFFTPKSNAKTPMTASPVGGHSAAGPSLLAVWDGFGDFKSGYASEGRVLTMEYDRFFLVVAYVPNSGMRLDRLDYRVDVWDVDFRAYLAHLDAKKPVVFGGDLNVGHLDADIYNVSAPHVKKSAGLTPRERESWSATLAHGAGFVDTFRHFHPDVTGWFTYWSGRAGNRPRNRGLRLDYFAASTRVVVDEKEKVAVTDGFILDALTVGASDHAPIGVTLALKE